MTIRRRLKLPLPKLSDAPVEWFNLEVAEYIDRQRQT